MGETRDDAGRFDRLIAAVVAKMRAKQAAIEEAVSQRRMRERVPSGLPVSQRLS